MYIQPKTNMNTQRFVDKSVSFSSNPELEQSNKISKVNTIYRLRLYLDWITFLLEGVKWSGNSAAQRM